MVEADPRDDRGSGLAHHIRRVKTTAETGFQNHVIRQRSRHGQKSCGCRDLEFGGWFTRVQCFDLLEQRQQSGIAQGRAGDVIALGKPDEMGRGVNADRLSTDFECGSQKRGDRAFAVRTRDMDGRRQCILRIAQIVQQAIHPVE